MSIYLHNMPKESCFTEQTNYFELIRLKIVRSLQGYILYKASCIMATKTISLEGKGKPLWLDTKFDTNQVEYNKKINKHENYIRKCTNTYRKCSNWQVYAVLYR